MRRARNFYVVWFLASLLWVGGIGVLTSSSWSKDTRAIAEFNYEITEEKFPALKGRHGKIELYETQNRTEPMAVRNLVLHLLGAFGPPLFGLGLGLRYVRPR